MDFGVVFQCDPPASTVVELARKAEDAGFDYVWTFDSHLLWQEPFVIYSQILATHPAGDRRPDGDEPGHPGLDRDRVPVRHPERDVRQPDDLRDRPRRLGAADARRQARHDRRDEAVRRGGPRRWPAARRSSTAVSSSSSPGSTTARWTCGSRRTARSALAATGEVGDGYILQLADPDIAEWMITAVRRSAEQAGRDPAAIKFCVAAPAYVGDDLAHQREQTRWFGGMVGNHVADIVPAVRRRPARCRRR